MGFFQQEMPESRAIDAPSEVDGGMGSSLFQAGDVIGKFVEVTVDG